MFKRDADQALRWYRVHMLLLRGAVPQTATAQNAHFRYPQGRNES